MKALIKFRKTIKISTRKQQQKAAYKKWNLKRNSIQLNCAKNLETTFMYLYVFECTCVFVYLH